AINTIINSTLSGNTAGLGGGISLWSGQLYVKNSTVVGNTARDGAALYTHALLGSQKFPRIHVNHTVMGILPGLGAGKLCHDDQFVKTGGPQSGIQSYGFNLPSDNTCSLLATTALAPAPVKLGPLANNGGPTLTHLPLAGSPVLNQGSPGTSTIDTSAACAPS